MTFRHAFALAAQRRGHALERMLLPDDEYDRIVECIERERLALFRSHVGATVVRTNRLLVQLCASEKFDIDEAAELLRPDAEWPEWLCGQAPDWRLAKDWRVHAIRVGRRGEGLSRFTEGGLVLRAKAPGVFGIGVRVRGRSLEIGLDLGAVWIRTRGGIGECIVDGDLPEVVATALPGRMLDELVGHPIVDGCGMRIVGMGQREARGSVVRFRCAQLPWRMPWARTSAAERDEA